MEKQRILTLTRIIWILLLLATVTSCTTMKPSQPSATTTAPAPKLAPKDRETALSRIQSWQVNGKIALQTAQNSGSATVDWAQNQRSYNISMYGPLGANGLKLSGRPGYAMLETSDGKRYTANSAEQLLAKRWGWNLPVSNLRYWIRGLPVPNIPAQSQSDNLGRLTTLSQEGWHIQYLSYVNTGTVDLPNKLFITSSSLRVKIFVYQWNVR